MMVSMGWAPGQGLGRDSQGRTSLIPTPNPGGGRGLGGPAARGARPGLGGGRGGKKLELKAHELESGKKVSVRWVVGMGRKYSKYGTSPRGEEPFPQAT